MPKDKYKLTPKEEAVLNLLWSKSESLTISQICEASNNTNEPLGYSTVQNSIRHLMEKGLVKVGDIVHANTVLARTFEPTVTPDEFAVMRFRDMMDKNGNQKISKVVAALLNQSDVTEDDLDELSDMIRGMQEK